ncbi:bZIP transcription factor 27-like isoform X3 [Olea europaea var. sylvestris]|uniref:bZIP transcription factor 27-like isoform X3 n=1 Tax=Olea europaea var. sylvestris TaxID=158386 RepID=UPI000C1D6F00|nr:bZIP transcription factor 27-like isoform X3 [Olea europaea var. sylvestris]
MEEVWDDINLSSLRSVDDTQKTSLRGANFQDFLARPFDKDHPNFGSPPPPPATLLTLNSSPDQLNFFGNSDSRRQSSGASGNKRLAVSDNNSRERRDKRMMKNRESATRSRARKQAYINELDLEVASLLKENARLLKQQQQLYLAAAAKLPKMPTLKRTLSAPF